MNMHVSAQTKALSLDEVLKLGLKSNNSVRLNAEKVAEAKAFLQEAKERRLPNLNISGSYLRLLQPTVDLKIKTSSDTSKPSSGGISVSEMMYGMANANLPLFSGFRIQNGIESAQALLTAAQLDANHEQAKVYANLVAAYINLYKSKIALSLVQENLKEAEQRVKDFANMEKNGLMSRNDLLKAQLQQSNIELALLDAQNSWRISNVTMDVLLGLDETTQLLPDSNFFNFQEIYLVEKDLEFAALHQRNDLQAMDLKIKAAKNGVNAAKGEYYPSLSLSGGYIAANIPGLLTITNAVNYGLGVNYSLSSLWKTESKVAQAKTRLNEINIGRDMLSDAIRLEAAHAYQDYLSAKKKIEVYHKAQEQAEENYRIVKSRHANALATTTELLDADVAKLQAMLNCSFAKADAFNAYEKLMLTIGGHQLSTEKH
jgi:outer membrane protein TolC